MGSLMTNKKSATTVRAPSRYGWLPDPLDDQHLAGGLLWSSGDLVGLVLFGVLFAQWVRASLKEAAREDRRLDLLEARARAGDTPAER